MAPELKVAVIGGGVAGLATARALKAEGILQIVVYEKSDRLGGTWVYEPRVESDPLGQDPNREIVHSSLYRSLRTNLPRQLMGFSDYPFRIRNGDSGRIFPGHEEVLQFLNEFAEDFGLVELIRFRTEVTRVERVGLKNDQWVVQSRTCGSGFGSESEDIFDAVVVCNGHCTKPRLASVPGIEKWSGKQMHSHNYRSPELFHNKIVVVIGMAASGFDISLEISNFAKEVHISSRVKPGKTNFKPISGVNIWLHPEINCVHENGEVTFRDGASVHADIILHCTGYKYDFPFLKEDVIVTVDDNCVAPVYKHVFPPKLAPTLSFVGLNHLSLSFPVTDMQAKWVSRVLSGKATMPSEAEMMAELKHYYENREAKGIPKRHSHHIGFEASCDYMNSVATEAGLPQVDEQLKLITKSFLSFVSENSDGRAWKPDKI